MVLDSVASDWFLLAALFVGLLGLVLLLFGLRARFTEDGALIQRKSRMLIGSEKVFFEHLTDALAKEYHVFSKVPLLDVVEPGPAVSRSAIKKIKQNMADVCFDYVLCKRNDLSIFGAIELENSKKSDASKKSYRRERLISDVCRASNLRLFKFDIRKDVRSFDIKRRIMTQKKHKQRHQGAQALSPNKRKLTIKRSVDEDAIRAHQCPKCADDLVTKVAIKGEHIGEKYLMCRKYPYCDYQVLLEDFSQKYTQAKFVDTRLVNQK